MKKVKDFLWNKGMNVNEFVDSLGSVGYQAVEIREAVNSILKMYYSNSKIFLTFTSNMVTSGLRGFFAQLCSLKLPSILVTTSGAIEEDIMKALGEEFEIHDFAADDVELHEKGSNRVGNILISNESYMKFEDKISSFLSDIYYRKKRVDVSDLLKEIGLMLDDENSILFQAAKNNIPIHCPGIADSSLGFHLFMFQQKNSDFVVDTVRDIGNVVKGLSFDEKKGIISLGGSISKHYAVFSSLLAGGFDYAVYLTTSRPSSGSMSGSTTKEAKSWGKIKDDSQAATVVGDVTITFPLVMSSALDKLEKEGFLKNGSY